MKIIQEGGRYLLLDPMAGETTAHASRELAEAAMAQRCREAYGGRDPEAIWAERVAEAAVEMRDAVEAISEAMIQGDVSHDHARTLVQKAIEREARTGGDRYPYVYIADMSATQVVHRAPRAGSRSGYDDDGPYASPYVKRSYTIDPKTHAVTLGSKKTAVDTAWVEVRKDAAPMAEALAEALAKAPAKGGTGALPDPLPLSAKPAEDGNSSEVIGLGPPVISLQGQRDLSESLRGPFETHVVEDEDGTPVVKGVSLIRPGRSHNGRHYAQEVLERDGPDVFEGAPCFVTAAHNVNDKHVRNLAGSFRDVAYADGALRADLVGLKSDPGLLQKAVEAAERFGGERVGLSIDTGGIVSAKKVDGKNVQEVERLVRTPRTAVDIVINPAAGGRLTESLQEGEMNLIARLTEADLSDMGQAAVRIICEGLTDDQIREANPDLAPKLLAKRDGASDVGTKGAKDGNAGAVSEADIAARVESRLSESTARIIEQTVAKMSCRSVLDARLKESKLGELASEVVRGKFERMLESGTIFESKTLDDEIKRVRDLSAKSNPNLPRVPGGGIAEVTESYDKNVERLFATCMPTSQRGTHEFGGQRMKPFRKISEAICAFEPRLLPLYNQRRDLAVTEAIAMLAWPGGTVEQFADPDLREASYAHLGESVAISTFTTAWADVLHRHLRMAVADPDYGNWRPLVSDFIPFDDLTVSHKLVRVGELGVAPTVAEGAPYIETTTTQTDDQELLSIVKKGYIYTVTWEAMLRDDIGVMARIPGNLGRSWAWTLQQGCFSLLQQNSGAGPTMGADGFSLYDNTHHANDPGVTAFTAAALASARKAMVKQTDKDSGLRKDYRPRFLLYETPDLDQAVWEALVSDYKIPATITNAGEVNLPNFIKSYLNLEPIAVSSYPTSTTTRWELMADPDKAPTIAAGFLGGREEPDIFIQDMENVGSRFSADKVTYKVRGTAGFAVQDYRSFVRGNT